MTAIFALLVPSYFKWQPEEKKKKREKKNAQKRKKKKQEEEERNAGACARDASLCLPSALMGKKKR